MYILTFGLAFMLFFVFLLVSVSIGVFRNQHILKSLERSGYYHGVYDRVVSEAEDALLGEGIGNSILIGVFQKEMVEKEIKTLATKTIYEDTLPVVETKKIEKRLEQNLKEYFEEKEMELGPNQQKELKSLCGKIGNQYKKIIQIPFLKYYVKYRNLYFSLMKMVVLVLLLGILFFVFIFRKTMQYISMAVLAASLMIFLGPTWILGSGVYTHLGVSPKFFYEFLVYYIKWNLAIFIVIGIMGSIISIGLILFNQRKVKKIKRNVIL